MRKTAKKKKAKKRKTTRKKTPSRTRKAKPVATPEPTGLPSSLFAPVWRVIGAVLVLRGADPLSEEEVGQLCEATKPVIDAYLGDGDDPLVGLALTGTLVLGPRIMQCAAASRAVTDDEHQPGDERPST